MKHLITGVTGFLGSALALEILATDADSEVVCIGRSRTGVPADQRVAESLVESAEGYGLTDIDMTDRVTVVEGHFGDLPDLPVGIDVAWHAAASLKYRDRDRVELIDSNVNAVRRIADWLTANGVPEVNHFSTAYVFGERAGRCTEDDPVDTCAPNNVYEETKRGGEQVIRSSGIDWRILRPSIIVGHSRTGFARSDSGIYGFLKNTLAFKQKISEVFGDLFSNTPVHLLTAPDVPLDLIPVDLCVRAAVHAGLTRDPGTTTHLSNALGPLIGPSIQEAFELAGLMAPVFVERAGMMSEIDRNFSEQIDFYAPYIRQHKQFLQASEDIAAITNVSIGRSEIRRYLEEYAAVQPSK